MRPIIIALYQLMLLNLFAGKREIKVSVIKELVCEDGLFCTWI
jgi:hypothetical protein